MGGLVPIAQAQSLTPLRVDPTLLGLPPIKPAEAPAPAVPVQGAAEVTPVDVSSPEAAVEAAPVEGIRKTEPEAEPVKRKKAVRPEDKRPVQAAPDRIPARAVAPSGEANESTPQEAIASPTPAPVPKAVETPVVVPPPRSVRSEDSEGKLASDVEPGTQSAKRPAPPKAISAAAAENTALAPVERPVTSVAPPPRGQVSSLGPLRVDPALLGQPPVAATPPVAQGRSAATPAGSDAPSPAAPSRLPATSLVVATVDADEASDPTPALALRASNEMVPPPKDSDVPRPIFLSAQRMQGEADREFVAEGEAELRKIGTVLNADRMTYWPIDDEVEGEGNVVLEQGEDRVSGPKMRLKLEEQVGFFEQPEYLIKRPPKIGTTAVGGATVAAVVDGPTGFDDWDSGFAAPGQLLSSEAEKSGRAMTEGRGQADRIDFEGENQIRLTNSTYTTCEPGNDDWYAKTDNLKLDYDREVGEGSNGVVYFKDVPIFYTPWLSFSLNNERKSGVLAPSFGTSSDNGFEFDLPYYWNIAPNMDATITPRVMSRRGVQLNNEFRYLNTAYGGLYQGEVNAEVLPGDRLRDGDQRYGFSIKHNQTFANGFAAQINYNKVSDDDYYTDLSSEIASTSQTQLLQQGVLTYGGGGWWSATANVQQYQTLQPDSDNPVEAPYKLLPQLTLNARKPDFHSTDIAFLGQYTHFTREDQYVGSTFIDGLTAGRTVLYPQLSLPYVTPGWYVTPKIGVNYRQYSISGQNASSSMPDSVSVTLPVFSIDSGMTFERPSHWFGRDYTQTLEPRLYYLNVPYKDQSDIPLFDTSVADFNFAQIFSENQFTGWDRVSDANQLTAAATTRLIEPDTGAEVVRAMLGQRFYFKQSRVGLNSTAEESKDNRWEKSDVLAAFSGQVLPRVYGDLAWQYNLSDKEVKRYSMGARYQPAPGKVLNAAYRYSIDANSPVDQVDISGQWPISGRWHAVGRFNYSFQDDETDQGGRVIESIAGLEYNGGCWVLRGVVRRAALTEADASTSFFVQLELSDFSRIGSNPLSLLKRNIQGYSPINQSMDSSVLDE